MAKAGFVLHGARGKVGNLVARKGENKTILAEYQPVVKNPQTNAQMAQRIILSTVAQAIPLLYPIIDHSFEGFAVGSKCTREFRRLNMSLLRQYAAIDFRDTPSAVDASCFMTTKGVRALIPNRYQISSGSLSGSKLSIKRSTDYDSLLLNIPKLVVSTHAGGGATIVVKLGEVLNAMFGITAPGEQITFVLIQKSGEGYKYAFNGDDEVQGWVIPYTSMRAARVVVGANVDFNRVVDINITDPQHVGLTDLIDALYDSFQASTRTDAGLLDFIMNNLNAGNYSAVYSSNDNTLTIDWDAELLVDAWSMDSQSVAHVGHAYAAGIIRSKLADNGSWMYSNSFMELAILSDGDFNYGLDWNAAIQAWFAKNAITDNSLFLKEGATANELGESFT